MLVQHSTLTQRQIMALVDDASDRPLATSVGIADEFHLWPLKYTEEGEFAGYLVWRRASGPRPHPKQKYDVWTMPTPKGDTRDAWYDAMRVLAEKSSDGVYV